MTDTETSSPVSKNSGSYNPSTLGTDDNSSTHSNEIFVPEKLERDEEPAQEKRQRRKPGPDDEIPLEDMDWDGPDDMENPKNWSNLKKWAITMVVAAMTLVVTLGSSLFVSGTFDIMAKMHASQTLVLSGLTFYLVGLSLGPILGAPLSELFGRRIVYITTLPLSMLFIMGVGLSKNIGSILVLRFFAGFFASPVMAIAGGTVSDLWDIDMVGLAMSAFCLAPFAGPILGPIIGGFAVQAYEWKWTMWVNLMFCGAVLPFVALTPETYKRALMRKRAKQRNIKIAKPKMSLGQFLKLIFVLTIARPLKMLVVEPITIVFSIYTAFVFAILFGFFEAYPVIFTGVYHFTHAIQGLTFIGIGVGLLIGTVVYIWIDRRIYFPLQPDGTRMPKDENGNIIYPQAESRLLPAKIGAVLLPISLFWQAWCARSSVHWMAVVAAGAPFGMSLLLIFYTVLLYFSLAYPTIILASALAANNLLRYIVASVFPLFTVQMYEKLGIDWASSLFGFIAIALMPVPWIFERIGPKLRAKSHYNRLIAEEERRRKEHLATSDEEEEEDLELAIARTMSRTQSRV